MLGTGALLGTVGIGTASAETARYVVGTTSPAATRAAERAATTVRRVLDLGPHGTAVSGKFAPEAAENLSKRPGVTYVEPVARVEAVETAQSLPWGVDRVDADVTTSSDRTGVGANVAIVDTGIDHSHPDISANYAGGYDYVNDDTDAMDDNGHGTHCAGIAAAVDNTEGVVGVAPGVSLYGVKVLGANGGGYSDDVAAGIVWAADNGMHSISLSLGSSSASTVIHDACKYASGTKGALVVAAAGNDGPKGNSVIYPAAFSEVVAVSATTSTDGFAYYSSKGKEVELAAPGSSIYSTVPEGGYGYKSGTSMACPHVAAAGGILRAMGDSNTAARQRLRDTAEDIGLSTNEQGYGLLDVEAAVASAADGSSDADTTAPSAPTNLASTGHTDTTVDLSWDASTDDTGVDHYNVVVDGAKATESVDTIETVSNLTAGQTYGFSVTAVDAAGNESDPSSTVSVTTDADSTSTVVTIDSFEADSSSPNNPHVEIEMSWSVLGSPESVTLELYEGSDTSGTLRETWTGLSTSGTQSYQQKFASPNTYTARLVAATGTDPVTAERTVVA